MVTEDIIIQGKFIDGISKPMRQTQTAVTALAKNYDSFAKVLTMPQEAFKTMNGRMDLFTKRGSRLAFRLRQLIGGARGFKMEFLGIMFFGMGLNRWFMGLLRPALDLVGAFDLLTTALGIFFLPTALDLLNLFILPFLEKVLEMDEGTRRFWGTVVLGFAVITGLLFLFGMWGLGINSIIQAYAGLGAVLGTGFAGAVGLFVGGVIIALAALALLEAEAFLITGHHMWEPEFWGTVWNGIVNVFTGAFDSIKALVEIFFNLWRGLGNKMPQPIQNAMVKIEKIFFDIWNPMIKAIDTFLEKIRFVEKKLKPTEVSRAPRLGEFPSLDIFRDLLGDEEAQRVLGELRVPARIGDPITTVNIGEINTEVNAGVFEELTDTETIARRTGDAVVEALEAQTRAGIGG